jgi:hypothetical protein
LCASAQSWHRHGGTAVAAGEWIKHIIEMAAAIDAKRFERNQFRDQGDARAQSRTKGARIWCSFWCGDPATAKQPLTKRLI